MFSAFKKQKQAKQRQNMPDEVVSDQQPLDEDDVISDLRELFNQRQAPKVEPAKQPITKVEKQSPKVIKESVKRTHSKPQSEIKIQDEEYEGFEFDKEQIDLRQAVIYSEILKRPYE